MSAHSCHPIRGRFNAWFLAAADEVMHREYGERKRRIFGEPPMEIVEIGPGTGANFRYYPRGARVIAVEPNPMMLKRLYGRAAERGLDLELRSVGAEETDLPSGSADLVVATLVLCSVRDPHRVVSEVRRILRPGARFAFLEHVAAGHGTPLRRVQEALRRPWAWLGEGCQLNRDTALTIECAGFSRLEIERFEGSGLTPVRPHIAGYAIR